MWESDQAQLRQQRLYRQVLCLPKYELPEPDGRVGSIHQRLEWIQMESGSHVEPGGSEIN